MAWTPQRVLIIKLSSLGDVVHALPVPCSLRATLPQAHLGWVIEEKWRPVIARHPDVNQVLTVDTHAARQRPHQLSQLRDALRTVRAFSPDCVLDLQGTLKSAVVTAFSGAPVRIGYARKALRERGAGFAYTHQVQPRAAHVVDQMLELAAAVAPSVPFQRDLRFPFPISPAVQREADDWIAVNHIGAFAFFSPGGGWRSKRWPSDRYATLAEMLLRDYGLVAVLNRGPDEKDMDDAYRRANQIRARLFSGDVERLGAILTRARLVVGGDTGPLQLAAALDMPTVALFGPTDPARNGPYSPHCRVIRKSTVTTYRRGASYSPSMLAIRPEEVAEVCGEVLAATAPQSSALP